MTCWACVGGGLYQVTRTPMRQTSIQEEVRAVAALNAMSGALHGGDSGTDTSPALLLLAWPRVTRWQERAWVVLPRFYVGEKVMTEIECWCRARND